MIAVPNSTLKGTPARVWLNTGLIEFNPVAFAFASNKEKEFMLLHETGHYKNQSLDETAADDYAMQNYFSSQTSNFSAPEKILKKHLPASQRHRINRVHQQALQAKYMQTGNMQAYNEIQRLKNSGQWMANFSGSGSNITVFAPAIVLISLLLIFLIAKK